LVPAGVVQYVAKRNLYQASEMAAPEGVTP
jgi:hypothetical protein